MVAELVTAQATQVTCSLPNPLLNLTAMWKMAAEPATPHATHVTYCFHTMVTEPSSACRWHCAQVHRARANVWMRAILPAPSPALDCSPCLQLIEHNISHRSECVRCMFFAHCVQRWSAALRSLLQSLKGRGMTHKRKGWFSWRTNARSTTLGRKCVSPNDRILPTRPRHQAPGKHVSFGDDVPPVLTGTTTCSCISQTKVSREIALVTRYGPLPGVSGI